MEKNQRPNESQNQFVLRMAKDDLIEASTLLQEVAHQHLYCADMVVGEAFEPVMKLLCELQEKVEKNYLERENLAFGEAIEALKKGYRVSRKGWNGKGMFLFLHEMMEVKKDDKILASPVNTVKGEKQCVYIETLNELKEKNGSVKFMPVICMKAANDEVVVGWLASQTDMLSNDWIIFE